MGEKKPNTILRRERELKGWSQQTVAEHLNTTENVVSRWESGQHRPNRHFQTQLCLLFGKSAEELGFMGRVSRSKEEEEKGTDAPLPAFAAQSADDENDAPPLSPYFRVWLCGTFRVEWCVGIGYEEVSPEQWGNRRQAMRLLMVLLARPGRQTKTS